MFSVSIQFILSACVVSFAAYKLCQYADVIATESRFGHVLVGLTALLGIVHRSRRKLLGLSWETWAIAIMYLVGTYFLFVSRLFTGAL